MKVKRNLRSPPQLVHPAAVCRAALSSSAVLITFFDLYGSLFPFSLPFLSSLYLSLSLPVDSDEIGTCPYSSASAEPAPRKVESRDAPQRIREAEGKKQKYTSKPLPVAIVPCAFAPVCFSVDDNSHIPPVAVSKCSLDICKTYLQSVRVSILAPCDYTTSIVGRRIGPQHADAR